MLILACYMFQITPRDHCSLWLLYLGWERRLFLTLVCGLNVVRFEYGDIFRYLKYKYFPICMIITVVIYCTMWLCFTNGNTLLLHHYLQSFLNVFSQDFSLHFFFVKLNLSVAQLFIFLVSTLIVEDKFKILVVIIGRYSISWFLLGCIFSTPDHLTAFLCFTQASANELCWTYNLFNSFAP